MNCICRFSIVGSLVIATVAAGCQPDRNPHAHGGAMLDEYRPAWKPVERRSAESATYTLWRWQPAPAAVAVARPGGELLASPPATRPGQSNAKGRRGERAVEVEQVFVQHGQPVGFRRRGDGQLIAVAGPTTRPLPAGHYCWHVVPGSQVVVRREADENVRRLVTGGIIVLAVAGVVAAVLAIDHNDRHAHLGDAILNRLLNPKPDASPRR